MKNNYQPPKIDYSKRRATTAQPNQSMSIQEIVRRYVKGIPVDVTQRQPMYNEQDHYDLEKLSRMDFGEKAELADQLKQDAELIQADFLELQRLNKIALKEEAAARTARIKAKNEKGQPPENQGGVK